MSNERETNLIAFANGVGADVKTIRGIIGAFTLATLTVPGAVSLIDGQNRLQDAVAQLQAQPPSYTDANAEAVALALLNGRQGSFATPTANQYASTQGVVDAIAAAVGNLRAEITGSAPGALDTLEELAAAFDNNPDVITNLLAAVGKRVAVDQVQAFTEPEKLQACENIGVGDPNHNFLADYETARDAV